MMNACFLVGCKVGGGDPWHPGSSGRRGGQGVGIGGWPFPGRSGVAYIYLDAGSAEVAVAGLMSFTVASGQPSAFHCSGMIARVAFPFIRRSPSKSDVNHVLPYAVSVPACPGPIKGPLVVARNMLPPLRNMSTPALSKYGPVTVVLRPMRML